MSIRILIGDVREQLRLLPPDHFDCVVTSPPYWGLRDYGVAGQIGLERTLGEHLAVMVDVFDEVRRVMKPTATLWLNYGDCYATTPNGRSAADTKAAGNDDRTFRDKPFSTIGGTLKPKDLCMIPNRLAIALQDAGWWVRSEIIWGKTNPMPESIKDRPATSHEKIWLLTKSQRYFYDAEEVRQIGVAGSIERYHRGRSDDHKYADGGPGNQTIAKSFKAMAAKNPRGRSTYGRHTLGDAIPSKAQRHGIDPRHADSINHTSLDGTERGSRSLRNWEPAALPVWEMATQSFSEAHFATFPPELAERCIKAGCPTGGLVLDPFAGAGTTGLVADRLQRSSVLIELNPEYAAMAARRIHDDAPLFVEAAE